MKRPSSISNFESMNDQIRQWLQRFVVFSICAFLVLNALCMLLLSSAPSGFFKSIDKPWARVFLRVQGSKKKIQSDTLFIGDSVAGQVFPFNNDNQLTSNGSVLTAGNYLLVANALARNEQIKTVIYLSLPQIIGHDFARKRSCNNFIKPFFTTNHFSHFDETIFEAANQHPTSYLYLLPAYRFLPVAEINFATDKAFAKDTLSPFAVHWLKRMVHLCQEKNVELLLASPPAALSNKEKYNDWASLKSQIQEDEDLRYAFRKYFASIRYYPDDYLRDNIHWQREFLNENLSKIHKDLFSVLAAD